MRWLLLLALIGCGGPEEGSYIAFKMHEQVSCNREGLQAHLQASGVEGFCPLTVSADREVSGTCFNVPAGAQRALRLIYFFKIGEDEYELAVAVENVDLTEEKRSTITVEFDELDVNRDDDGDAFSNLVEFCCGSDPGNIDDTCN